MQSRLRELRNTPELREGMNKADDFHGFMEFGDEFHRDLVAIVHQEAEPSRFDQKEMRRWLGAAAGAESHLQTLRDAVAEGTPYDEARVTMAAGAWAEDAGLTEDEAAAELLRRTKAGEPLPWEDGG